jgi:hypothetical protein
MSEQLLLDAADKLRHANDVYLRDVLPGEAAADKEPGRILMILIGPHVSWARAEIWVSEAAIADPEQHTDILQNAQTILDREFLTLSPGAQGKSNRGEYKKPRRS